MKNLLENLKPLNTSLGKLSNLKKDEELSRIRMSGSLTSRRLGGMQFNENLIHLQHRHERIWMRRRGKNQYLNFDEQDRETMKQIFRSVDKRDMGYVTKAQLMEPMIALGLITNRLQLDDVVARRYPKGIEFIELHDFIRICEIDPKISQTLKKLGKQDSSENLAMMSFDTICSKRRRKFLMNALSDKQITQEKKQAGQEVLRAYDRELRRYRLFGKTSLLPNIVRASPKRDSTLLYTPPPVLNTSRLRKRN